MKICTALLFCLLCCIGLQSRAADKGKDTYIFSQINNQQGLSNSAVISVFQDNSGLMWFGTYDGICCYDGKEMDVFRSDSVTGLASNIVYRIQQAYDNCLWIVTGGGLNRFSPEKRKTVGYYKVSDNFNLHSNRKGDTWMVGYGWVAYYNPHLDRFVRTECPQAMVSHLLMRAFVTDDGKLWLFPDASPGRYCLFSVSSFEQDTVPTFYTFQEAFHSKPIEYIHYQNGVFCFVDSEKDLYMYDIPRKSKIYIRNIASLIQKYGEIKGIVPFHEDIAIAFWTNGLIRLRTSRKYEEEVVDRNVRIFDIYTDPKQGILWLGSDGQGVFMYARKNAIATNVMLRSLSPNLSRQVRSIMTDKYGGLWFGTKGDGLLHLPDYSNDSQPSQATVYFPDGKQPVGSYVKKQVEFQVYALQSSRYMDGFWVGTGANGLLYYSFVDDRLHTVADTTGSWSTDIHAIYEENESSLYLATAASGFQQVWIERSKGGIRIKRKKSYRFLHEGRPVSGFFSMQAEGDSVFWLGSRGDGLVRFNRHTEEYRVISLALMLNKPVDDILCMRLFPDGKLWVGTTAGLICLDTRGETMQAFYTGREQGLLNDMVHGMLKDANGLLWLSTNKGLIRYNPANRTSHAYYYSGGIQIGEFSDDAYYKCPYTGNLFFGGIDGLLYMAQEKAITPEYYPDIVLRKLLVGGTEVPLGECLDKGSKALRLQSSGQTLMLKFIAPDYVNGADIEYSYMLEGYDDRWMPFGRQSEATYTRLPAGKYVFKARYKKDVFDTEYKQFAIPLYVAPLWYQTLWARLLYATATLLFAAGVYKLFKRYFRNARIARRIGELELYADARSHEETVAGFQTIYEMCNRLDEEELTLDERLHIQKVIREKANALLSTVHALTNEERKSLLALGNPVQKSVAHLHQYECLSRLFDCQTKEQAEFASKLLSILEHNLDREELGTTFIADKMAMSPRQFYRKFKEISGTSPSDLIKDFRMEAAARLLQNKELSIQDVIADVGISSRSYFYKEFTRKYGTTPKSYRESLQEKT